MGTEGADQALTTGFVANGGGYRAVVTRDGEVVWRCAHVHFTDHSARACAERELKRFKRE
jgi:hypothetical protein